MNMNVLDKLEIWEKRHPDTAAAFVLLVVVGGGSALLGILFLRLIFG